MALKLPKSSFLALAAVGWADGSLKKTEGAGLVRAAQACGIEGADLAEVEKATKEKVAMTAFDAKSLSPWERALTYALASWMACLDGVQSTDESETLHALGDRLELDDRSRKQAASAAFDISCLPEGGRPEKYDFAKLAERLKEKLPKLA